MRRRRESMFAARAAACIGAAACVGGVAACSFELTDLPGAVPAQLRLQLRTADQPDIVQVTGGLHPGRHEGADGRTVVSDLVVHGQQVPVVDTADDGTLEYDALWALPEPLAGRPLSILAPEIEGIPAGPHIFELSLPRRVGPLVVTVPAGGAAVLPLDPGALAAQQFTWRLEAFDNAGTSLFTLLYSGRPPQQVVVPRSWFPPVVSGRQRIRLVIHHTFASALVPDHYDLSIDLQSELRWLIEWQD